MFSPEAILKAARTVQTELPALLGAQAAQVDAELVPLMAQVEAQVEGQQADGSDILLLLAQQGPTRDRMRQLLGQSQDLRQDRPQDLPQDLPTGPSTDERYHRPPGDPKVPSPLDPTHQCSKPGCDYQWTPQRSGQTPDWDNPCPDCPEQDCQLVPIQGN
jgi:hypothetical protein